MTELLRERVPQVALRGSSLGGFLAIHAAARDHGLAAVVAICPAPEALLRRLVREEPPERFPCDAEATERWLDGLDLYRAAGELGPETALLLLHARGDELVPWTVSEELHAAAREPKRLLVLPGGHHRSLQHDEEMQAVSRRFILQAVRRRAGAAHD
jgi:fermentation-respiration switch protein FrsA (DUF1100 family)